MYVNFCPSMTSLTEELGIANEYASSVLSETNAKPLNVQMNQLLIYLRCFTENLQNPEYCTSVDTVNSRLLSACSMVKARMIEKETHAIQDSSSYSERHLKERLNVTVNEEDGDCTWTPEEKDIVTFNDVVGGQEAISVMKEALVFPVIFPILFKQLNAKPWQSVLLYGPPGTGKSLIARATANEVKASFFKASCAELTSKWVGGSEKLLKSLFEEARRNTPAIIFLDEIDSIASKRTTEQSMADQRLTNQLLIELDTNVNHSLNVFVIAATNLPWAIDLALLRRMGKRIYIPLPDEHSRKELILKNMNDILLSETQLDYVVKISNGLSSSDIIAIFNDMRLGPLRLLQNCSTFHIQYTKTHTEDGADYNKLTVSPVDTHFQIDKTSGDEIFRNTTLSVIVEKFSEESINVPVLTYELLTAAFAKTRPTVDSNYIQQYISFDNRK